MCGVESSSRLVLLLFVLHPRENPKAPRDSSSEMSDVETILKRRWLMGNGPRGHAIYLSRKDTVSSARFRYQKRKSYTTSTANWITTEGSAF